MFALNNLNKKNNKKSKRVGRGKRGDRGAKSGRGTKGSLKRGKIPLYFEGGNLPLTKRIPLLRGKGKNKSLRSKPVVLNISDLNCFQDRSAVNIKSLVNAGLIKKHEAVKQGIKILGRGEIRKVLSVKEVYTSVMAKNKIEKAGGSVQTSI